MTASFYSGTTIPIVIFPMLQASDRLLLGTTTPLLAEVKDTSEDDSLFLFRYLYAPIAIFLMLQQMTGSFYLGTTFIWVPPRREKIRYKRDQVFKYIRRKKNIPRFVRWCPKRFSI